MRIRIQNTLHVEEQDFKAFKIFTREYMYRIYYVILPLSSVKYLKGTWQRGGFSGVFAEIGSA
jgi:hypothetical protein